MLSMTNCRRIFSKQCKSSAVLNKQFGNRSIGGNVLEEKISSILNQPLIDHEDGNIFDIVGEWRSENIYDVEPAQSIKNLFKHAKIPQHPYMAENNWNSGHQDSWCSESVGLFGPDSGKLKLIKQYNPYGFVPIMVCNSHNQMIGVSFKDGLFRVISWDSNCNILTSNLVNTISKNSFGGGYFYLNQNDDTIVVKDHHHLACYNTSDEIPKGEDNKIGELELKWQSDNLADLMCDKLGVCKENVTSIYSTLPIWNDPDGNKYWVLVPGSFDYQNNNTCTNPVSKHAYIVALEINPNSDKLNKCDTNILDCYPLPDAYVNNTLAADEDGLYFVTNQVTKPEDNIDGTYKCNKGNLMKLKWDNDSKKIVLGFESPYKNAGYLKYGMANVGSGTTPTIFKLKDDCENTYVTIGDNDSPRMNICIYDSNDGKLCSETPVFNKMRSCDEASFIGVNGRVVAENNFGHSVKNFVRSQYISNDPGMTMVDFNGDHDIIKATDDNIVWNKSDTRFFAMSMLCRKSGIIYAYTCDWSDDIASTKGGQFSISAIDSFDGREVWRVPIGRGHPYQHAFGGVYFDRCENLFVGSYDYLVSIQNFDDNNEFL